MAEEGKEKKRITEGIEIIIDEAGAAVRSAFRRSGAESLGENLKETIRSTLSARENVVMVRLNKESLERVDDLVEAEVVNSRSEASAFLIAEGIKAKAELFGRIAEKIEKIRQAKQELRDLLDETPGEAAPAADEPDRSRDE